MLLIGMERHTIDIRECSSSFLDNQSPCSKIPEMDANLNMCIHSSTCNVDNPQRSAIPDTKRIEFSLMFFDFF